jgi:hypothetical protein
MDNVKSLNKPKTFNREGELSERLSKLIGEYDGELSLVAVLGILDLKKMEMVYNND